MNIYARLCVLLPSLAGPTSAALNCRPEGPVLPKANLGNSPILKSAGAKLTKTLDDAVRGVIQAGWPVENVSFFLAVVSMDHKSPGVPVWEYHHRAEMNNRRAKKVTRDSQYLVGSVSKVISDCLLLKAGVDIDRPVTGFLPKLNSSRSRVDWEDMTLRMLGSQLSGAPANILDGFSEYYYLKELCVQSGFPPLEEATGRNYTELVADIVSKPLGLRNTLPSPGEDDKADDASRDQAEKQYARTFKSRGPKSQNRSIEATFELDSDSLLVSEIRHGSHDVFAGIKKIWGQTMGRYTATFGSTVRLFHTDLSQRTEMDGKNVTAEVWRLWPEFGEPVQSDLPGSSLGSENCFQWTLGDWIHYRK